MRVEDTSPGTWREVAVPAEKYWKLVQCLVDRSPGTWPLGITKRVAVYIEDVVTVLLNRVNSDAEERQLVRIAILRFIIRVLGSEIN